MALLFAPSVQKAFLAMPAADRDRLLEALRTVAADTTNRVSFATEMRGIAGAWRLRKGNWRAVYRVDANGNVVVERVDHRREVYK